MCMLSEWLFCLQLHRRAEMHRLLNTLPQIVSTWTHAERPWGAVRGMESMKEREKEREKEGERGWNSLCMPWLVGAGRVRGPGAKGQCEKMNEIGGDGPGPTNGVSDAASSHFPWALCVDRIILATGCNLIGGNHRHLPHFPHFPGTSAQRRKHHPQGPRDSNTVCYPQALSSFHCPVQSGPLASMATAVPLAAGPSRAGAPKRFGAGKQARAPQTSTRR